MKSSTSMAVVLLAILPAANVRAEGGEFTSVEGATATIVGAPRAFNLHLVDDDHEHRIALGLGTLGTLGMTSGDIDAVLLPRFNGATGFTVNVYIDGVLRTRFEPRTAPLLLRGFGGSPSGALEKVGVELTYGLERADRWSLRITRGRRQAIVTPVGPMHAQDGPDQITVQTTGIDRFLIER